MDYQLRVKLLKELQTLDVEQVVGRSDEGLPKLWVVHKALQARGEHPEWFGAQADYVSLTAEGAQRDRVIAFQRGEQVLTVAPRWSHEAEAWGETAIEIPEGVWRNWLTGERVLGGRVRVGELLEKFPVALLTHDA